MEKINCIDNECRTLRVDELAQILGVGRSTAYNLVHQAEVSNGIPFAVFRVGGTLLISKKSFIAYLDSVGA